MDYASEKTDQLKDWFETAQEDDVEDFEEDDFNEEELYEQLIEETEKQSEKDWLKHLKITEIEKGDEFSASLTEALKKIRAKSKERVTKGGEPLTEHEILEDLLIHFNPKEASMKEFIDRIYRRQQEGGKQPETKESIWERITTFFKQKFLTEKKRDGKR